MIGRRIGLSGWLFLSLIWVQMVSAAPIVRQASFQRIFDGTNHYAEGEHLTINLSTMSSDGKVVAFYGYNSDPDYPNKMFVHDFDSIAAPVEVDLASLGIGNVFSNTGLISNADGSRIFFVADDARDTANPAGAS